MEFIELKRLAVAVEVMYDAAKWSWSETVAKAHLGKTTAAYALAAAPSVVVALVKDRDEQACEVQRQLELRRLEWSRAEGLQAQLAALQAELVVLRRQGEGRG